MRRPAGSFMTATLNNDAPCHRRGGLWPAPPMLKLRTPRCFPWSHPDSGIRHGRQKAGPGFYGAAVTFTRRKRWVAVAGVKLSRALSVVALSVRMVVVAGLNIPMSRPPADSME